ncbi:MAG: alkaline phosphatase family protein [Planctomycetota bacterium]
MSKPKGPMAQAVLDAYARGEEDEALSPLVLTGTKGEAIGRIRHGDYVIFYDIRGEREVELTEALTNPSFQPFDNGGLKAHFVTMIEYHPKLDVQVAFPPQGALVNSLVEVASRAGLKILKLVETEKSIHLSFFLNGKREQPFPNEERRFVESLKVADYAEHPEMCIEEVRHSLVQALEEDSHDLIVANYANVDVIGHIENRKAVQTAVEAVDRNVGAAVEAARRKGREVVITADHGTVEKWYYPDGKVDTGHTTSPVPFIYVGEARCNGRPPALRAGGSLIDVAPTLLEILGLAKPAEMTGTSLFDRRAGRIEFPKGRRKVLLLIADGWGYREADAINMIAQSNTPHMNRYMKERPWTTLAASGEAVGLPAGTVGNSEAGHMHLGAGRVVYSDRLEIDRALADGTYFENPAFVWAIEAAKKTRRPLHLLGIVSFFSSHGSLNHLLPLMRMARDRGVGELYIHSLLGRRGERPEAGAGYIGDVEVECEKLGLGRVVTVIGRYWALDREYNWGRIEKTFRALVHGEGRKVTGRAG